MSRIEPSEDAGSGIAPTLPELIALRALALGRRGARRGRHGVQGHALSNLRGRGMEYAESREYAQGDDARHIDWRLTARSGNSTMSGCSGAVAVDLTRVELPVGWAVAGWLAAARLKPRCPRQCSASARPGSWSRRWLIAVTSP